MASYLPSFMVWNDGVATKPENQEESCTSDNSSTPTPEDSRDSSSSKSQQSDEEEERTEEEKTSFFGFGWMGTPTSPTPIEPAQPRQKSESTPESKSNPESKSTPKPQSTPKSKSTPSLEGIQHIDSGIANKFFSDETRLDKETRQCPASPVKVFSQDEKDIEVEMGAEMLQSKKKNTGVSFSEEATDHLRKELESYMKKQKKKKSKDGKKSRRQQRRSLKKYLKKSLKKYLAQKEAKAADKQDTPESDEMGKAADDAAIPRSEDVPGSEDNSVLESSFSSMEESIEIMLSAPSKIKKGSKRGAASTGDKPKEEVSQSHSKRCKAKKDAQRKETQASPSKDRETIAKKSNDAPPKIANTGHRPKPSKNLEELLVPQKQGAAPQKKPSSKIDLAELQKMDTDDKKKKNWNIARSSGGEARSPSTSPKRVMQPQPANDGGKKIASSKVRGSKSQAVEKKMPTKVPSKRRKSARTNALNLVEKDTVKEKQATIDELKLFQKEFAAGKHTKKQKAGTRKHYTQEDSVSSNESMTKQKPSTKEHCTQEDSVSSNESMTKQKASSKNYHTQEDMVLSSKFKTKQKPSSKNYHTQEDLVLSSKFKTKQKVSTKDYYTQEDLVPSNESKTKEKVGGKKYHYHTQEDVVPSSESKTKQMASAKLFTNQEDLVNSNESKTKQMASAKKYITQEDLVTSNESKTKQEAGANKFYTQEASSESKTKQKASTKKYWGSVFSNQSKTKQKARGEKHDTQEGSVSSSISGASNESKTKQKLGAKKYWSSVFSNKSKASKAKKKARGEKRDTQEDSVCSSISGASNFSNDKFFRTLVEEQRKSNDIDQVQAPTFMKERSPGFALLETKMQLELERLEEINNGLEEEERKRREQDLQVGKAKKDEEDQENEALEFFEITKQMMRDAAEQREAQIREEFEREQAAQEAARDIDERMETLLAALAQAPAPDDYEGEDQQHSSCHSYDRNSILVSEADISSRLSNNNKIDDYTIYPETVCTTVSQKQRDLQEEIEAELANLVALQDDFVHKVEMARQGEKPKQGTSILQSDLFTKKILSSKPLKSSRSLARDMQIRDELSRLRQEQSQLFSKGLSLTNSPREKGHEIE